MVYFFKRLLIRLAKELPFILVFMLLVSHIEAIHALFYGLYEMYDDGSIMLQTPIGNTIGSFIYLDYFDVFLLYTLCFALELCWKTFMCVHTILANLVFRNVVESIYLDGYVLLFGMVVLSLASIVCIYLGIEMNVKKGRLNNKQKRNDGK